MISICHTKEEIQVQRVTERWDFSTAGVERKWGREPPLAPFAGENKVLFPHNLFPSSPSTQAICAHISLQVVSWPASPGLSQYHPHLADGVVQAGEPAGISMLLACCLGGWPLPAFANPG